MGWFGLTSTDVRHVEADVTWNGAGAGEAKFGLFLGYVSGVSYDGETPVQAKAWVQAETSGARAFGPATYALVTNDSGTFRRLTITGVPPTAGGA